MNIVYTVDETVSGLANRRMSGLGQRLRFESVFTHVLSLGSHWFQGILVAYADRTANNLKSQAIWFRGASDELLREDDGTPCQDLQELLAVQTETLEGLKAKVLELRKTLLELQEMRTGSKLKTSLSRSLAYSADLFDALESYRWTLMELEASQARISDGYQAESAADIDAMFERITTGG